MSDTDSSPGLAGHAAGGRRLIVVVFADMVGYSRLVGLDDGDTLRRLQTLRRDLIDPAIHEYGGRIAQTGGDSLMIVFDSIDGAVRCAIKIQQQVPLYDLDEFPDRHMRFRFGINIGDAIPHETNLVGDGVNIAARLQAMCPEGGICVSRAIRDHVHTRLGLTFQPLGPQSLKNIAQPVEAFLLRVDPVPAGLSRRVLWSAATLACAVVVLLLGGAAWWLTRPADRPITAAEPTVAPVTATSIDPRIMTAPPLSLVVLPFANLGGDRADDYLVDAITDDLTGDLSHIPGAFVISRVTGMTFRNKPIDVRTLGAELGVRYALEGSVRRLGQVLRVNVQLISTGSGAHVWSDRFDQQVGELDQGQEEIVIRMRSALSVTMTDIEAMRLKKEHPTNPDAFDLALQARMALNNSYSATASSEALRLSELALKKDPNSILALTTAAFALTNGIYFETIPRPEALDRAAGYVERARRIRSDSELVMNAEASLLDWQRNFDELLTVAHQITQMFPNDWWGFQMLGVANKFHGRYEVAIPAFEAALRLNPRSSALSNRYWNLAHCAVPIGRDSEAIAWTHLAMTSPGDLSPEFRQRMYVWLAVAYQRTGDAATARDAVAEAVRLDPFDTVRAVTPDNPGSPENRAQFRQIQVALRQAGYRDHADPDADFGVATDDLLHALIQGRTPTQASGVRTVRTADVVAMLADRKPLVLDTMWRSWRLSIAGALGLNGSGFAGDLSDLLQAKLGPKMQALTDGDLTRPIVVMGFNTEHFDGRNLALRLVALGYTQVYWYRGGREAWEVAGLPEVNIQPADW